MTEIVIIEPIQINIIDNICQCCCSPSSIFIENNCQHLVCIECYRRMKTKFNRDSCLFCDPLNESQNKNNVEEIIYHKRFICNDIICILVFLTIIILSLLILRTLIV